MSANTASMSMLTLFESRYTLKGRYSIGNVGINCFYGYAYSLLIKVYINPNPLAILATKLPESAKIQHHAQTLTVGLSKVSLSWLYSTESIKIQQTLLFEWVG